VRDFLVDVFRSANPEETLGKTPTAVDLLDGGAQQAEHGLQDQPALQTQLFDALGNAYTGLGRYDRAKALLGKGRQIAVAAFGVDSLPAQRLAVDFAKAVRFGQGPYDEARAMLAEIVAHDSHASAEADALTIAAMVESGAIERNTGNLDAAEVDLRGAVARARELGKSGEATLLEALSQFAEFADAKGRRAEAIDTFREVIAIGLRQTTPASAQVAAARRELATLLGQSGKNDEAESILREVVAANRDLYGIAHPAYLTSLIELARALIRKPAFAEAEALLDEALATARSHFGEDNEATAQAEVTLGALKYAQSDIAKAIDLDQQALRYCVAHDGDNSSRVWLLRQNLARMQVDNGQYAAAESGLRELLAGLSRIHSDQTGDALELLGDLRRYQGDAASAMQLHQQALDVLRKNGDEHSFDVQELKLALAQDARDLNRFDLARNDAEAGRDGLIALHQDANAKMIVFARYAVAQIDTLQGHCAASLPALEAMWEQNKSRGDTPMLRWKTAQSGLFVGLCRKQLRAADTAATHALIATNAAILRNSALADPYMKHLAVVALHAN
jgi:serine/threonine-protein kinase